MKKIYLFILVAIVIFSTPQAASANCFAAKDNERLLNYCLVQTFTGRILDFDTVKFVSDRLNREGYARKNHNSSFFQRFIAPILEYSTDINGGNPNRALVLGNLTFTGDETLLRKEGLIAGVGVGANGRHIYGEGRYLDFGLGLSYAHSPEHDIGISRAFANIHSKNHIRNHWYVDAYGSTNKLWRDLTDESNDTIGVNLVKLFATEQRSYHQATVGVRRFFDDDYEQNQLIIGLQTINSNGQYTAVNATVGANVENTLATSHSISATLGTTLFHKQLSATYAYSFADGGKILGVERNDTSQSLTVTYAVHPRVNLTLGYRDTDSSIGYFSESEPFIGIQFAPINF